MNIGRTSLQGLIYHNRLKAYQGFTIFTPLTGKGDVWLIDMEGNFVHQWQMPLGGTYGRLLPNGNLLYGGRILGMGPLADFGGSFAKLIEADSQGNVVWEYDDAYLNHDFYRMKNGNTMVIRWAAIPKKIAEKVKGGVPGSEREGVIWGDCLREITPDGKVAWEWIGYEHMDPEVDILCPLCGRGRWANANAVFVLDNGDVLLTLRFANMIAIVDRGTSAIKWRWGPGELAHPHDAQVLENGNILVFDNGLHRIRLTDATPCYSRVVELNPNTEEIVWEYRDEPPFNFYSHVCSGCQRLPNGNTLICEASMGRIFEVTPSGETVWEYIVPFYNRHPVFGMTNYLFRAYRYGLEFEGVKGVDQTSWKLGIQKTWVPAAPVKKETEVKARLEALGY